MESNQSVLDNSEIIFIALPPDSVKDVLKDLRFNKDHSIVSFVPFMTYDEWLTIVTPALKVCRAVPFPTVEIHVCPILLFNPDKTVCAILENIGTPIVVQSESELQILWTLTGMIAPFYDLCETLSNWAQSYGVESSVADKYVMELFYSLTCYSGMNKPFTFSELKREATTPNGMNYEALTIVNQKGANAIYRIAAEAILRRFKKK